MTTDQFVVVDPTSSWRTRLEGWAEETLDRAVETGFGDLVPNLRPVLEREIDAIGGPCEPCLGGGKNYCREPGGRPGVGRRRGGGGAGLGVHDHRHPCLRPGPRRTESGGRTVAVRAVGARPGQSDPSALLDGYEERASTDDPALRLAANRSCYELLSLCRATFLFDDWPGLRGATPTQEAAAAVELRTALEAFC